MSSIYTVAHSARSRFAWLLLILLAGLALWLPGERQLAVARLNLAELRAEGLAASNRTLAARLEATALQEQLRARRAEVARARLEVARAQGELRQIDPDSAWAQPPADLPHWDPACPYIWLPKEVLSDLPVSPFAEDGKLRPEVGVVMAIDDAQRKQLNEAVSQLLGEYRRVETASVRRLEDHLPGVAGAEGAKLTFEVPPLPEEATRFKEQFQHTLRSVLGEQRGELLVRTASGWLNNELSLGSTGSAPKVFSVVRRPDGGIGVCTKTGQSWLSTVIPPGSPIGLEEYVPPHLLPLFEADRLEDAADEAPEP